MSRLGRQPIALPAGTTVTVTGERVEASGPKGLLTLVVPRILEVVASGASLLVRPRAGPAAGGNGAAVSQRSSAQRALWGTTWAHLRNAVVGVSEGFERQLELQGVGYRADLSGSRLRLSLGFTHQVEVTAPSGITFRVEKNIITVTGANKHTVGEMAASLRRLRPPEPYKGTGVRFVGEVVRRKAGKTASAGTAAA